jgi:hypothetical protein
LFVLFAFLFFILKLFSERPIEMKCSTPEVRELFHVEQFAATGQAWNILQESHETQNVPPQYNKCSTWNILPGRSVTFLKEHTKNISIYFKSLLLAFIFIMLFDHYFWDINQGQILLWLLFGLLANNNKTS